MSPQLSASSQLEDASQTEEKNAQAIAVVPPAEKSTQPVSSTPNSKEGGLPGYLTVLGSFLALFAAFGQANSFGTFQSWYEQHQLSHMSASDISWIGTLQLWVFFFSVGKVRPGLSNNSPNRSSILRAVLLVVFSMLTDHGCSFSSEQSFILSAL
jgi:hypothetical protein